MRKRLPWTVIVGCSVAILGLARVAEADSQGASDQRVAVLVRDLGAPEFSAREEASRELLDLGIVAHDALLRATQSDDAEVRVRARRILVRVLESDFQDRLEAFAAHYEDAGEQSLPAWDLFSADYGTSRLARELFVEMQRAEPEMLAALAEGPKAAADALNRRTRQDSRRPAGVAHATGHAGLAAVCRRGSGREGRRGRLPAHLSVRRAVDVPSESQVAAVAQRSQETGRAAGSPRTRRRR